LDAEGTDTVKREIDDKKKPSARADDDPLPEFGTK
jgi:hypothetical protein